MGAAIIYRIVDWKPSEARQNAEVFVGRACMVVLGGALAMVLSQVLFMMGLLDGHIAQLAGNASTCGMLAGFAGIAVGACLAPPMSSSQHGHGHGHGRSKEAASGQRQDDEEQGQKPA
ncbi:hypothetical protein CHLRE_10g450750v5 [Chlamydomonas reinhardtii]|uniref:Uncharacterized protein n=1 Tax=Chlamydomonas reinhardtii TaxID=3055 RepID=A0A2K3DB55_CHLRE|nr:uncharacterized protein CHLRE_10g450750v5 [Chlamydomonas reinhardtii]PNW77764.1 hypothetical protein CHLRE_10g450750v5 [Chlamydomonas reinhardtii]